MTRKRDEPRYTPTPEEIEAATRRIRRNWSETEYRHRAGIPPKKPMTVEEVNDPTREWWAHG